MMCRKTKWSNPCQFESNENFWIIALNLNHTQNHIHFNNPKRGHFTEPVRQVLADLHPKHVVQCANGYALRATPAELSMWPWTYKIGWRKVETCKFGSTKWFLPFCFAQFVEAGEGHDKTSHIPKKSVINITWLVPVGCY